MYLTEAPPPPTPTGPQPTCPVGHGRMRRSATMSTGIYPGWWHYCIRRTCQHSEFVTVAI